MLVQTWNQDAGTITSKKLPDDLKEVFKQSVVTHIPSELIIQPEPSKKDWSRHQHATALALINLIGAWNEKNEADIDIINRVINEDYLIWVLKAREILQLADSPFSLQNGLWEITERTALWDMLGTQIFDRNLNTFKEVAVSILTERDPSFELPPQERYTAGIHGKVLTHSLALRKGMAESLALLGNRGGSLINCSQGKAEATVILAIREIFENSDWVLWGSLDSLFPVLAEAAPEEFLEAVENALCSESCPFDTLFSQEGSGITGGNYLTGLLWALELWINHSVADALNARDAEDMRRGFRTGIFNSRGVHWVDPTGKPERELAEQYRRKAEDVENAGYQRLAVTLRGLSESYEREAERIVAEHKMDEKSNK